MTPELHRPVALDRIGAGGLVVEVVAEPDELAVLAARMGLPSVGALRCQFELRRVGAGLVVAEGRLLARVTQVCVVTLDPFESELSEAFTVHFVPTGEEEDEPDPDAADQIPYEGGAIDLGEAASEQLALALDPYPRQPGAELPAAAEDVAAGPFATLASLRPKS